LAARLSSTDRFLREPRSRFGGDPIPHEHLTLQLLGHRSESNVGATVVEQAPAPDETKYWVRFLNQDSTFFVGADAIARTLESPVLSVHVRRVARGRYRVRVSPLAQPPYERGADAAVIESYAGMLEHEIRDGPADSCSVRKKRKCEPPSGESARS
jgi:KDO2-lipid IV(A) lauroyltransferase